MNPFTARFCSLGRSLQIKLMAVTLAIILAFNWGLVIYATRSVQGEVQAVVMEQQAATVRLMAADLDQKLRDRLDGLQGVARMIDVGRLGEAAYLQSFLDRHYVLQKRFTDGIKVLGVDGKVLADFPVLPGRRGVNYVERDYFRETLARRQPVISGPLLGKASKHPVLVMSVPVLDMDGEVRAVMTGSIDLGARDIFGLLSDPKLLGRVELYLFAPRERLLIASTDSSRVMSTLPAPGSNSVVDLMLAGQEVSVSGISVLGIEKLYTSRRIDSTGWILGLALPTAIAFQPVHRLRQALYGAAALTTLLALFMVAWWSRRLLKPLGETSARIEDMSDGRQPLQHLPEGGDREVRRLQQSFNRLTDYIARQQEELRLQTEQLRANILQREQAAAEKHRLAEALRQAAFPVLLTDANGCIVYVNPAFQQLFGHGPEALHGRHVSSLCPPEGLTRQAEMLRLVREEGGWCGEMSRLRQDGSVIPLQGNLGAIRDGEGEYLGLVASFADLRSMRAREDALRISEERYRVILEGAPDAVLVFDPQGRIVYANPQAARLVGGSRAELLKNAIPDITSAEDPAATLADFQKLLTEGALIGEYCLKRRDGSLVPVEVSAIRLPDGNYHAALRDLTLRKQIDEELEAYRHKLEEKVVTRTAELAEARRQAEEANQAKSAFLANMSHEIRTPLNAILGFTHLLGSSTLDAGQQERLGKIDVAAAHLLAVINDILDVSKIEADKLVLESMDFSPADLCQQAAALVQGKLAARGLDFRMEVDGLPPVLRGDVTRLRQALLNYLGNAIKFTERGQVSLSARIVEEGAEDILVRFEVRDTGIGIAPAALVGLFRAFEQADTSTTREYGGTGLGLTITRRLALLMGGDAGAESQLGQGSCFWFTARLEKRPGVLLAQPLVAAPKPSLAGAHVLLVEDNPVNQEVALDLLREMGVEAELAVNGQVALARLRQTAFDLVLMDMQMPVMGGVEATRLIRLLQDRQSMPIIAMTANAFLDDRDACLAAGMNDFVSKPVSPEVLYAVLLRWLPCRSLTPPPADVALEGGEAGLHARLAAIPGLDLQRGLVSGRGKPSKLARFLRKFVETHGRDGEKFQAYLLAGNFVAVGQQTHGLKGAAGFLGATRVLAAALALEEALQQESDTEALATGINLLAGEIGALVAGISIALAPA